MSIKIIKGNLVVAAKQGQFDIIMHGCNCFCNMGAGIAKEIKKQFPRAYAVDCETKRGDGNKLGTISVAHYYNVDVVNAYTQFTFGRGLQLDYKALRECLKTIKQEYSGKRIGMPKIGCGLAGGNWDKIQEMIEEELKDEDVTIMYL